MGCISVFIWYSAVHTILLFAQFVASVNITSSNNIAIYWGQNSYGQSSGELAQQRLATYCANTNIDIVPIAFVTQITTGTGQLPVVNLANQQSNCTLFPGTELINCPQVGEDIKVCQAKYGKKVLLSIGGATYTEGGFSTTAAAVSSANLLWKMFGPRKARARRRDSKIPRPFGDAVIDGFDFDFESTVSHSVAFAARLRHLMDQDTKRDYYLTAAPQCVYPDAADSSMLNSYVPFDALFVQFYNNYCGLQAFQAGAKNQSSFNFAIWDQWAQTISANPNVKIFMGIPAGPNAAGSGYTKVSGLKAIIDYSKTFRSFGGIMMWDASQAYANRGFLESVKGAIS